MIATRLALAALVFSGLARAAAFDDDYSCTNMDSRGVTYDHAVCPSKTRLFDFTLRRMPAEGPDLRAYEYDATWSRDDASTTQKITAWAIRVLRQWQTKHGNVIRTHTKFTGPDVNTGVTWFQVTEEPRKSSVYWVGDSYETPCPNGKPRTHVYRMNCVRRKPAP